MPSTDWNPFLLNCTFQKCHSDALGLYEGISYGVMELDWSLYPPTEINASGPTSLMVCKLFAYQMHFINSLIINGIHERLQRLCAFAFQACRGCSRLSEKHHAFQRGHCGLGYMRIHVVESLLIIVIWIYNHEKHWPAWWAVREQSVYIALIHFYFWNGGKKENTGFFLHWNM